MLFQVMSIVEMAILSTDLASYFEKRERFLVVADAGEFDWQVNNNNNLQIYRAPASLSCMVRYRSHQGE